MLTLKNLRLAGFSLALLIAICAVCWMGWAQSSDPPIVISDGSLSITSPVPWSQFTGTGDRRAHPNASKTVNQVIATINGADNPIPFANQACTVDVTYANGHIVFSTNNSGNALRMTGFNSFNPPSAAQPNVITHRTATEHITHIKITKAGRTAFEADVTSGTKVSIFYQ
jgi:hypothetical protein